MTELFNKKEHTERRKRLRNLMPQPEVVLWSRLRGRQMAGVKFRRQFGVGPYVVDFLSPELKLAIEVDGDSHFHPQALLADARRQDYIQSLGIQVLRFTNVEVMENLDGVLQTILAEVEKRINPL